MRFSLARLLRAKGVLGAIVACLSGGCSLVDYTLSPRAYDINRGTQNLRESAILLNIVRASRSEPLNFVALSKYTGSGSLAMNESILKNDLVRFGTPSTVSLGGSFTTGMAAITANNFDVGTLENREFYGGFLSPIDLEGLNLLLNAGLNREIVFHSVLQAFRVTFNGRAHLFVNDPADDAWTEDGVRIDWSPKCQLLYGTDRALEPIKSQPIWFPPHEEDCRYQKFLYFVRVAVRWGVTVEAVPLSPHLRKQRSGARRSSKSSDRDRDEEGPRAVYFVCFDPAIAQKNRMPGARVDSPGACGSKNRDLTQTREFQFRFSFNAPIQGVVPIVRSPYAVFQFYGKLLANGTHSSVRLSELSLDQDQREAELLTIARGGIDCFARAFYAGVDYCVPNDHTKNTKEIFVLLNTLVALSTNRSALPVSPTFVLTP